MKKPKKFDRSAVMKRAWATRRKNAKAAAIKRGGLEGLVAATADDGLQGMNQEPSPAWHCTVELSDGAKEVSRMEQEARARDYQQIKEFMEFADISMRQLPNVNFFQVSRSSIEAFKRVFGDKL